MKLPVTHPSVRDLFQTLGRQEAFQHLVSALLRHESGPFSLAGLTPTAKALYLVLLWQVTERPLIVVADGNQRAEVLAELTGTFFDLLIGRPEAGRPHLLPALDVLPGQQLSPHTEISEQRAIGLWRMAAGTAPITIAPAASALLRTHDAEYYRRLALAIRTGEELPLDTIEAHLRSIGYERRDPVEMVGEYSIRGGILDVFGAESARPLRIEFFGDEIESIRRFDVETQRSDPEGLRGGGAAARRAAAHAAPTFPGWEFAAALEEPREHSLLALAREPIVILDEPEQIRSAAERLWKRLDQSKTSTGSRRSRRRNFLRLAGVRNALSTGPVVNAARTAIWARTLRTSSHIAPALAWRSTAACRWPSPKPRTWWSRAIAWRFSRPPTASWSAWPTFCANTRFPSNWASRPTKPRRRIWPSAPISPGPVASTYLIKGLVRRGAVFPESAIAFIGSEDLFDSSDLVARPGITKSQLAAFAADLADLKPGDFVVHTTHGVGRFLGLREIVAGRAKGRLHAARIRRRRQALRAADAHGPGREISRRRRIRAAARPARRRDLDQRENRASKPRCATWRTSC